jgi:sugar-specific transcriptional regulator TrmB
LSLERVLQLFRSIGFSRVEAEVFVYLAKAGPTKPKDLMSGLGMTRQQLYSALKTLKKKRIVDIRLESHTLFSTLTFEELLNRYMKISLKQAETIKETKEELLDSWQNMSTQNNA